MRYAEHAPPDALARVLHCLWTFEDDAPKGGPQRIVPDGRCELIVHLGNPYREAGARAAQPRVLFAGQLTRPLRLAATGPCSVVAARFRPGAARAFVGFSMRQATDRRLAVAAGGLVETLEREPSIAARAQALAGWLGARLGHAGQDDTVARTAADRIEATRGNVCFESLARDCALGRRQLERRFGDQVGVGPALLATIFRFRSVFDLIEHDSARPWTDAALAAGYFDQSHFIRDFRRFVGCTPSEFHRTPEGIAQALV